MQNHPLMGEWLKTVCVRASIIAAAGLAPRMAIAQNHWISHARDPQHTAKSSVASHCFNGILWQTPVDLNPQYSGTSLLIHYGSPLVTTANTVIVPVKTGATGNFRVEARNGSNGALIWMQSTDYILPPASWTTSFGPVLTPSERLYFPGAGGTVYYRDTPDSAVPAASGQLAFFGMSNYMANPSAYNSSIKINTPISADSAGNITFGFQRTASNPLNLQSGLARISAAGIGTWVTASAAAGDAAMTKVVHCCAPAYTNDGSALYVAVNNRDGFGSGPGYLLKLNSTTLATIAKIKCKDPSTGNDANLSDVGSGTPTVGPDGDVYFGVLASNYANHSRGWLLHYSGDLATTKTPGAFGWDVTPSIVPAAVVPSYTGASSYLLMTKYNNYGQAGGDGVNRIAILDPNASMIDPISGATVMLEVLMIAGPTPDPAFPSLPNAVKEWCINTAAVDPLTNSVIANNEDGKVYRWDLTTNTLTQKATLTAGIGEAYTPTIIGVDGTSYAINNAILFAVGHVIKADMDCDADVDDEDFDLFAACATRSTVGPPATGCEGVDFDHDNDNDMNDFGRFQRCISGPDVTPSANCAQ